MSGVAARQSRIGVSRVALAVVALAMLGALLSLGRWEGSANASLQNRRMAAVYRLATVDGLTSGLLDRFRLASGFDCLSYHPPGRAADVSTYELCFDSTGRLVQTIDRRTDPPHFASLLEQPSLATLRVPVPRLLAAFAAVGAFLDPRLAGVSAHSSVLPVGFTDIGSTRISKRRSSP